jgi:uncharacterized membrane protein YdcZ (DUF606 family)
LRHDLNVGINGKLSVPEPVATLNIIGLLLTIIGVLLLFQKWQHRYDWWRWLGLVFIVAGTVCQIMANRV